MQLYQITDIGTDYIQPNDIFEIAAKTPIIQCFIDDGVVKEFN